MFKLFDENKRSIKILDKKASEVEKFACDLRRLSDEELKSKTLEFKERYKKGETLESLRAEAFAVCRESAKRVLGLYPYRVQVMGSLALDDGDIAEMKTGEGKTLTATMVVYLNALSGKGVHVVTVNEYLSLRDVEEMGKLYEWLGLTVSLNSSNLSKAEKREAYLADITYSTNSELGFDFLRDNIARSLEDKVQRPLNFALIDEADSVLIDEARTPLIISTDSKSFGKLFTETNKLIGFLNEEDYTYKEEDNSVLLTDTGIEKAERLFRVDNLYSLKHQSLNHAISQSLKAHKTLSENTDYVVQGEEVILVNDLTGRLMEGRRLADGLHQTLEAKEGLPIKNESKTIASTTFQNYFRKYEKLAGMTGTAETEEEEFRSTYNMKVVVIPTHNPIIREDKQDLIYATLENKYRALINDVKKYHEREQPVLIGTVAIETSELISKHLTENGIPHEVLNAKNHQNEAQIIANAGQRGSVTIATNMAGRGTDIKPGEGVLELGGLVVMGTERHETRRIDNQLRGRSGRQGNAGVTQFYLSLEDKLVVSLGPEKITYLLAVVGTHDEKPIQSKLISKALDSAQKQAEGTNYDARKMLLQFDDVMKEQRDLIYEERELVLNSYEIRSIIERMIRSSVDNIVDFNTQGEQSNWNLENLLDSVESTLLEKDEIKISDLENKTQEEIRDLIKYKCYAEHERKELLLTPEVMRKFEKDVLLQFIDSKWTAHMENMENLRQGIHLRTYAQIDPLREYRNEGFAMLEESSNSIRESVSRYILKSKLEMKSQENS